jgi:hypothetical protein
METVSAPNLKILHLQTQGASIQLIRAFTLPDLFGEEEYEPYL